MRVSKNQFLSTALAAAACVQVGSAATIVVAPTSITLTSDAGNFTGTNRTVQNATSNWIDGTSLQDGGASVQTGAILPTTLPLHAYGWSVAATPQSRIRSGAPMSPLPELTMTLGGAFDLNGLILWNHGEGTTTSSESDRGISSFTVSFSTDGTNFTGSEALTFTKGPQGGTNSDFVIAGEIENFSQVYAGVTHVRLSAIDSFAGAPASGTHLVNFGEIRLTAIPEPSSAALLGFGVLGFFARRRR